MENKLDEMKNDNYGPVRSWIRDNDFFGHQVHFNFDRNGDSHKTLFGGCYSLFIKLFILSYFYVNVRKLFFHIDDGNSTTVGLYSTDSLGNVGVSNVTNTLMIYVLKKKISGQLKFSKEELD